MVVIHHYGGGIFPFSQPKNIFHSGNLAVSYFFVLSGFVLYVAHANKPINYLSYLQRRAARIFPLYYTALLLTVGVFYMEPPLPANMKEQVMYGALMIQSYIPSYAITLNSPAWTISVEMFFYLIFPLLLALEKRSRAMFAGLCLLLFTISQYLHLQHYEQRHNLPDNIIDPLFFSPVIHISQFMIGMMGGWFYKITQERPPVKWYVPVACFAATILLIEFRPDSISYHVGLIAPLFAMLIIAVARSRSRVLNTRGFIFLGEISYGVYILQYPVFRYLQIIDGRHFKLPPTLFFFTSLCILLLTAATLHYAVERPLRNFINRKKE